MNHPAHKTNLSNCTQTLRFRPSSFTGKERDEETGFGYFGARYMDHELMTMWLSVDPMADKYPSISPYAYCAWDPVKMTDPDGKEAMKNDDWYRNKKTGAVFWHEGHAKHVKRGGVTYDNIGESYSKRNIDGTYSNYYQNYFITIGQKRDASKLAYRDKGLRTFLISNRSNLPVCHKIDLYKSNVASRGMPTPDMMGFQLSANLIVGGGLSVDVGMGYIREDGMYGSFSLSPGSGFDFSISAGLCSGYYHGSDAPSKANFEGLNYTVSAGAGSLFYQFSTSDLRGNGWNVSTYGASVGSEIFLGGTAGVSHSWIW